jgi:phosphate-selective porin OprO and OprP
VKQHLLLLAAACGLACATTLLADDKTAATDKIQAQIDALQKELDALKQAQQTDKLTAQEQPKVSLNYNRATITSADGRSSVALRAMVQADAAYFDQDPAGTLTDDYRRGSVGAISLRENNAARDLSDGMYFRRARFGFEGMIARDFNYRLIVELGGAGTEAQGRINDAWISYSGFAPLTVQIGAFSPPANLDDGTPADETLFIERATPNELSRALGGADGRIGVGIRGNGSRWMSALTFTGRTVSDPEVLDAQNAFVGRAAFLAMTHADYNLHVGASGTYVVKPADPGIDATGIRYGIRFRDRPELRVDSTRLIDTGVIDAEHAYVVGAELAGNWRQFYVQAENFWYGVDRKSALDNPNFGGYYVQGSWLITGESHRYNMTTAAYQAPRPRLPFNASGGIGAWELALRFSHMDLNYAEGVEGAAASANSIRGGLQDIWTVGINWYVAPSLRFILNYQRVDIDRFNPAGPGNLTPFGAAPATPPIGVQIGQQYDAIALRSQFSF